MCWPLLDRTWNVFKKTIIGCLTSFLVSLKGIFLQTKMSADAQAITASQRWRQQTTTKAPLKPCCLYCTCTLTAAARPPKTLIYADWVIRCLWVLVETCTYCRFLKYSSTNVSCEQKIGADFSDVSVIGAVDRRNTIRYDTIRLG